MADESRGGGGGGGVGVRGPKHFCHTSKTHHHVPHILVHIVSSRFIAYKFAVAADGLHAEVHNCLRSY